MQSEGKVGRYLQTGRNKPSQNEQPGFDANPAPERAMPESEKPIPVDESLFQNSLTPVNVLKKIQQDIVRVIGIRPGYHGKFTPLEEKMIQSMEKVVRKGQCPSLIFKDKDLWNALECLARFFESARVILDDTDGSMGGRSSETTVFKALMDHAREAARLEKQIKDQRSQLSRRTGEAKKAMKNQIDLLKAKKDNCLFMYQKVVFSDAGALQTKRKQRQVSLFGKPCTLDDLLSFFRKGGSMNAMDPGTVEVDDAGLGDPLGNKPPSFGDDPDFEPPVKGDFLDNSFDTGTNLNFPGVMEKDDLDITFDDNDQDDVVDWIQIKKKKNR